MKGTRRGATTALVAGLMLTVGLLPMATALVGNGPGPADPVPGRDLPEQAGLALAGAGQLQGELLAFSQSFENGASLGEQLLRAATGSSQAALSYELPAMPFDQALAALHTAAGLPAPATDQAPPAPLAEALAPVIMATAASVTLTDQAFAELTAEERTFLDAHVSLAIGAPVLGEASQPGHEADLARFADLAQRVDLTLIALGAGLLADALEAFQAPPGLVTMASWTSPGGLVEVGGMGDDVYTEERLLIVDLGGNDIYENHAGAIAPGHPLPAPVSAVLDAGGNDVYRTSQLHPSGQQAAWGQAVGISGIGLLVDRWGNDVYRTWIEDQATCNDQPSTGQRQLIYAQGVGTMGVGALFDLSGDDAYVAFSLDWATSSCPVAVGYSYAQGVGLFGGLGLLVDDTGDDKYAAGSIATGKLTDIAHAHAQGAAAGGTGVLVDKEGHDQFAAGTFSSIGPDRRASDGDLAYTFAQGSVLATRFNPAVIPSIGIPGLDETCVTVLGFFVCLGSGGATISPCGVLSDTGQVGANGPCDTPSVGLLLDVAGSDLFQANAVATDVRAGCGEASWAVTSAQGSATFPGLAALVNVDVGTGDELRLDAFARGDGCQGLGVRGLAYGQGYGGAMLWDPWDAPSVQADGVGIGILLGAGPPGPEPCRLDEADLIPSTGAPLPAPPSTNAICAGDHGVCPENAPCLDGPDGPILAEAMLVGPDKQRASSDAVNVGPRCLPSRCLSVSETRVQGAAERQADRPEAAGGGAHRLQGVGLNLDTAGDDVFEATSAAVSDIPREANSLTRAQGASKGGIGALINVGGDDRYDAIAYHNFVAQDARSHAQAVAEVPADLVLDSCIGGVPLFATLCSITAPSGILIDVFGQDWYSEAERENGCPGNGATSGPYLWGTLGVSCATVSMGEIELGLDWASELPG